MSLIPLYDGLLAERLAPLRAVTALHDGPPGEPCAGCGLDTPCPTARTLTGELTPEGARTEVRRERVARAVAGRHDEPDEDEPARPSPVLPSAAELFAPNPGTSRALDALLGGPFSR